MFNFGNNVDRDTVDKVDRAATVDCWQTGDKLATKSKVLETKSTVDFVADLSPVLATVDFVASVYRAYRWM